ncbi:N-acetylglucosamine-6-phosphate deacetylase [Bacillus sp. AK031]
MNKLLIKNVKIFAENKTIPRGYAKIKNGRIIEIGEADDLYGVTGYEVMEPGRESFMVPGMIDVHIHGVNGADTMDATIDALEIMAEALPKEGTTGFLATTMTDEPSRIESALKNIANYMSEKNEPGTAEILGIHLEGPFINKKKAGAQPENAIKKPSVEVFKRWQQKADDHIRLVTLAPEEDEKYLLIQYLKEHGIIASAGHSNATYKQMGEAVEKGVSHVTHLFNQMTGLHHREPGVVGAAFNRKELVVELIADGIHVSPAAVEIAFNQITEERLILITDSMRAKCLKNGKYELGGQTVHVQDGKAMLDENTLAGSVLKMKDAFKNIQQFSGCDIRKAIRMTAENPAKELNCFNRKGSISEGKDADLVVLDHEMNVELTICRGKIAYRRGDA